MQRTIDGLSVTIVRKSIKNMHLRVLSPDGEIQITAPNRLPLSQIDRFVREKRGWIEARQQQLAERPAATNPAFADGQTVYLWGGSYTLRLEEASRGRSALQRGQEIVLSVHPEDDTSQRESLLNDFYREALSNQIAARLPLWEARTGLHPSAWQIKNMKTRWGTCNTATARLPRLRHRARADASALSRPWAGFQNIFDVRHAKLAGGPKSTQQSDVCLNSINFVGADDSVRPYETAVFSENYSEFVTSKGRTGSSAPTQYRRLFA